MSGKRALRLPWRSYVFLSIGGCMAIAGCATQKVAAPVFPGDAPVASMPTGERIGNTVLVTTYNIGSPVSLGQCTDFKGNLLAKACVTSPPAVDKTEATALNFAVSHDHLQKTQTIMRDPSRF